MKRAPVFLLMMGIACTVPSFGELEEERPTPCPADECMGPRSERSIRAALSYSTFRPGCLTVTVADKADPSRELSRQLTLGTPVAPSQQLTVAVFPEEGWSQDLVLTATAYETACEAQPPRPVATATREARVPDEGVEQVSLELRAEDLDEDGFVRADQGGSDCEDDDRQVNPRATEVCGNRRDDNCSGDETETDAAGAVPFYEDSDKDGFGNPRRQRMACAAPAGYVADNRDCDDANASVRPDQPETLCDGADENCNGTPDDTFNVGLACTTSQSCGGAFACQSTSSAACVSSQTPSTWFVDSDGDQRPGTSTLSCVQPPGSIAQVADCDETSPFVFNGGPERCDRLDNNCDTVTDEGCSPRSWQVLTGSGSVWRAVTSYAENKAWVAGLNNPLAHVAGNSFTPYTDCPGNWEAAWANPSDGRVFLGSDSGVLATRALGGTTGCETVSTGRSAGINGLIGFGSGASATLFAVTGEGRIFRWDYTGTGAGTVVEAAQVAANLRDIHGTSPTNLVAVGAETINSLNEARIFSTNPATGEWRQETLPATLPPSTSLRGVHMVHSQLAYAVGSQGVVLQGANGIWSELPRIPDAPLGSSVAAYGRTAIYVVNSPDKKVYFFDGTAWLTDYVTSFIPFAVDGVGPHDVWVAGSQSSVLRRGP